MTDNKNKRQYYEPWYNDKTDYNTNAPSYYDFLARYKKQLKTITDTINKLLDRNIETKDTSTIKMLKENDWDTNDIIYLLSKIKFSSESEDFYLKNVLNHSNCSSKWTLKNNSKDKEGLFSVDYKPVLESIDKEIGVLKNKIDDIDDVFYYQKYSPKFISNLGGIRNAVCQSVNIDDQNLNIYETQSDSQEDEGFFISKLAPNGKFLSFMRLEKAGHGTMIGVESRGIKKEPYIWAYLKQYEKLVRFVYQENKIPTQNELKNMVDFTPESNKGTYFTPVYDKYNGLLAFRFQSGRVETRKKQDVLNGIDKVVGYVDTDTRQNSDDEPMQGCVTYDRFLYYQSGNSTSNMRIAKYDLLDHKKLYDKVYKNVPFFDGVNNANDGFKEPEGLAYFVNPENCNHELLFVITTGAIRKRFDMLYTISKTSNDYWRNINALGSQQYKITRSDGRALSLREEWKHLDDVKEPGIYHVTNREAKNIGGFPYPVREQGWYIEVLPRTQVESILQRITRASQTLSQKTFTRYMHYKWQTDTWDIGSWTSGMEKSEYVEHAIPRLYDNNLKNITMPGEYYLTNNAFNTYRDSPTSNRADGGYHLYVTAPDSQNHVMQYLDRNSDNLVELFRRRVDVNSDNATNWILVNSNFD